MATPVRSEAVTAASDMSLDPETRESIRAAARVGDASIFDQLEVVDTERTQLAFPLVEGAVVVYIGSARNRTEAFVGRIFVEEFETGDKDAAGNSLTLVRKSASDHGVQSYDFSTHDAFGRLIKSRLMPERATISPECRNKRFNIVEHPEHLRKFMLKRNANNDREYRVLVPKPMRATFDEYVRMMNRRLGVEREVLQKTIER